MKAEGGLLGGTEASERDTRGLERALKEENNKNKEHWCMSAKGS